MKLATTFLIAALSVSPVWATNNTPKPTQNQNQGQGQGQVQGQQQGQLQVNTQTSMQGFNASLGDVTGGAGGHGGQGGSGGHGGSAESDSIAVIVNEASDLGELGTPHVAPSFGLPDCGQAWSAGLSYKNTSVSGGAAKQAEECERLRLGVFLAANGLKSHAVQVLCGGDYLYEADQAVEGKPICAERKAKEKPKQKQVDK